LVVFLAALAACSSDSRKVVVSDVQKIDGTPYYALDVVDEKELERQEEEKKAREEEEKRDLERRVEQHLASTAAASKPIYGQIDRQVRRVELKKTVVKPVVSTDLTPRILSRNELEELMKSLDGEGDLGDGEYADPNARVLVENYRNILKASVSCCPSVSTERMKAAGVPRPQMMRFLSVDSREYAVQNMCMIVSDRDIRDVFSNRNVVDILRRSRRDCICNNADFLKRNVDNFYNIYNIDPGFYDSALVYRFRDAEGRIIKQDILEAVINISGTLIACP
jgi:hypothetical protein